MWVFKPRENGGKGGFGIGPDSAKYKLDGIEAFLYDQADKVPTMPLDVKKSADDLTRLADVTLAVADILYRYRPDKKKVGEKELGGLDRRHRPHEESVIGPENWVKEQDEAAIKRAASSYSILARTRCHNTFRDRPLMVQKKNPAKILVPRTIEDAVNKMADDLAQGKDVRKDAAAFFKANPGDLQTTMWIFKPRMANGQGGFGIGPRAGVGGFGIGPRAVVYAQDGIEMLIINKGNPKPRNPDQKGDQRRSWRRTKPITSGWLTWPSLWPILRTSTSRPRNFLTKIRQTGLNSPTK